MDTLFSECRISQKFSILKINSKSLLQSVRDDTAPEVIPISQKLIFLVTSVLTFCKLQTYPFRAWYPH